MRFLYTTFAATMLFSTLALSDPATEITSLKQWVDNPEAGIESKGPIVVMGTASLDNAKIIFLPEIHDDPESLSFQLMLIAREKAKGQSFIILDESLDSLKRSVWDIFSQKSLEVIAARKQRQEQQNYEPKKFELTLQNLAAKFRSSNNRLSFLDNRNLWALTEFSNQATPFYGWDARTRTSLVERNVSMVSSLEQALKSHNRILLMAGARHIPELEYLTSKRLLCSENQIIDQEAFFNVIEPNFGEKPNLLHGVGATAPINKFLANQPYAVVFSRKLYDELDRIVAQFKQKLGKNGCLNILK